MRDPDLLAVGADVGGYRIESEIGKGGMGVVYSATHGVIGKRVAIKVLRRDMVDNRELVDRFIQEARSVNQIGHPNIVDIFAFDRLHDGRPYLVMDLLVGESLRKRVKRGPLDVGEAASIFDETASALQAAHDKGFIHRDLKPDNVFLCERDGRWPEVKLLDFGLAKLLPSAGEAPFRTKTGVMLGTPDYMAPELVRRTDFDHRVDIYALGVMAFESLAHERPFASPDGSFEKLQQICETPAPELLSIVPNLPRDLAYLVDAMLLKDPNGRPSLADVRAALKRLRAVLPSMSMEMPTVPQRAHNLSFGGVALAVGAEPALPQVDEDMIQTLPRSGVDPDEFKRTTFARNPTSPPLSGGSVPRPDGLGTPGSLSKFPSTVPGTSPGFVSSPALVSGAAAVSSKTQLGVAAPVPSVRTAPTPMSVATAPAPRPKSNPLWLVFGALLAVGAGIALALALAS